MSSAASRRVCAYHRHACSRPRYQKYNYCAQHVLEDTTSPFTSCEYISRASGRKCPNPALRSTGPNNLPVFCDEHLRDLIVKEQHQRNKRKLRKKRKNQTVKSPALAKRQKLISQLSKHYGHAVDFEEDQEDSSDVEEVHRPVKDDWLLEDSDDTGNDADWDDFDPVNNEVYEPLRYADVLTPEEVVATAQSKLIRLQSLYIEQFKRLFHLLKERRRQYLHDRTKEMKEGKAGASNQKQDDDYWMDEDEIYALATYRRRTGVELLLRKQQLKRRQEADGSTSNFAAKSMPASRCSHMSNHMRCKGLCLPYTKYCMLHILEDPHQQLYRKCQIEDCPSPVCFLLSLPYEIKPDNGDKTVEVCYCSLHAPLPEMNLEFPQVGNVDAEEMEVDVAGPLQNPAKDEIGDATLQPTANATEVESSHLLSEAGHVLDAQQQHSATGSPATRESLNDEGSVRSRAAGEIAADSEHVGLPEFIDPMHFDLSPTQPLPEVLMDSQATEPASGVSIDSLSVKSAAEITADSKLPVSIHQTLSSTQELTSLSSIQFATASEPPALPSQKVADYSSTMSTAEVQPVLPSYVPTKEREGLPTTRLAYEELVCSQPMQLTTEASSFLPEKEADVNQARLVPKLPYETDEGSAVSRAVADDDVTPACGPRWTGETCDKYQADRSTATAEEQESTPQLFSVLPATDEAMEACAPSINNEAEQPAVAPIGKTPKETVTSPLSNKGKDACMPTITNETKSATVSTKVEGASAPTDELNTLTDLDADDEASTPQTLSTPPDSDSKSATVGVDAAEEVPAQEPRPVSPNSTQPVVEGSMAVDATPHPVSEAAEDADSLSAGDDPNSADQSLEDDEFLLGPVTGITQTKKDASGEASGDEPSSSVGGWTGSPIASATAKTTNANNNCSTETEAAQGRPAESEISPAHGTPPDDNHRGERKPSSVEEEMAVVSLLSLCSSTPSSSTDQE